MHWEPDVGFDPRSPGSRPGPKAGAKPLRHPGIPERKLSESSEGGGAYVGFLRGWDKGEDHSKPSCFHSCRHCSWPADVETPGPGIHLTLSDKTLLFSEDQVRTHVN